MGPPDDWQDSPRWCLYVSQLDQNGQQTVANFVTSANVTVKHSNNLVSPDQLPPIPANQELPPEKIDSSIDKWFFISGASA